MHGEQLIGDSGQNWSAKQKRGEFGRYKIRSTSPVLASSHLDVNNYFLTYRVPRELDTNAWQERICVVNKVNEWLLGINSTHLDVNLLMRRGNPQ